MPAGALSHRASDFQFLRKTRQLPAKKITTKYFDNQMTNITHGLLPPYYYLQSHFTTTTTTTVLWPFSRDHPGEPVPEENFWTLWCKRRLKEADTPTIRMGATPSGLTSAHLHLPPFFTGRMPFLPPNQVSVSVYWSTILTLFHNGSGSPKLS